MDKILIAGVLLFFTYAVWSLGSTSGKLDLTPTLIECAVQSQRHEPQNWIRDSEDFQTAPIQYASYGLDGAALYFVPKNEAGYTILGDVTKDQVHIGYVYVDPNTGGVIVQLGEIRVGVR